MSYLEKLRAMADALGSMDEVKLQILAIQRRDNFTTSRREAAEILYEEMSDRGEV